MVLLSYCIRQKVQYIAFKQTSEPFVWESVFIFYCDTRNQLWTDRNVSQNTLTQTLRHLRSSYLLEGPIQAEFCLSRNCACIWIIVYAYRRQQKYPSLNPHSTLDSDRPQHGHPASCVIAQQYSSASFVSLPFSFQRRVSKLIIIYYCICTVHVVRSLNCQYQHMHNFNVTG